MSVEKVVAHICKLTRAEAPIGEPILKMGGKPVFYEEVEWPVCTDCGQKMDFLGQFPLQSPQRLSENFHMAYVFMCSGKYDERGSLVCRTFEPFSGANVVILQRESNQTYMPDVEATYPDFQIQCEAMTEPLEEKMQLGDEEFIHYRVYGETKVGGFPMWLQMDETPICQRCHEPMNFLAQMNADLDGPYPAHITPEIKEFMQFLNFGGFGMGYLFICQNECDRNSAAFLWQCQ